MRLACVLGLLAMLLTTTGAWCGPTITQTIDVHRGPAGTEYTRTFRLELLVTDPAMPAGDFRYKMHQHETLLAMTGPGEEEIANQAWLAWGDPEQTVYSNTVAFTGLWPGGRDVLPLPPPDATGTISVPYPEVTPGGYLEWALRLRWR